MFRISVVCEGPTDTEVIRAVVERHLDRYVLTQLQPEQSRFAGHAGPHGGGWRGVCGWCESVRSQGGLAASGVHLTSDVLIVHVDADIAGDAEIACAAPCPPPDATVESLRRVVLAWLGETSVPARLVLCIPAQATEAWVLAGVVPDHPHAEPCDPASASTTCLEYRADPAGLLVGGAHRLVRVKQGRYRKDRRAYQDIAPLLGERWPQLMAVCRQAARFDRELGQALARVAETPEP